MHAYTLMGQATARARDGQIRGAGFRCTRLQSSIPGLFLCVLIASMLLWAPTLVSAQTYTRKDLQDIYINHLTSEGFRPDLTAAGNVRFRREGRTYFIYVDEKDPNYFRLSLAFTAEDKSSEARAKRLEAVNLATADTKVAKAYLDKDGDPVFSVELFTPTPGAENRDLNRLLRTIDFAYEKYLKRFREAN